MKRRLTVLITFVLFFLGCQRVILAQTIPPPRNGYQIESFDSTVVVEKNTSLMVTEKIVTDFSVPKHGIYRVIPDIYSARGRTINARIKILSVADEEGRPINYEQSRLRQSIKLKIGDADKTITGRAVYVIRYQMENVLQQYDKELELYWNVTGHEWDTSILSSRAVVVSDFARINKVDCFAGEYQSTEENCEFEVKDYQAEFKSKAVIYPGNDFTIVVGLAGDNRLNFPGIITRTRTFLADNWGYLLSVFPLMIIFGLWYKKGRDLRFVDENPYFVPKDKRKRPVSIFERKLVPLVYSPMNNLTPAEVGTIIDERIDIHDVVAEVVELARLGYLKIEKIKKQGLLGGDDYLFIRQSDEDENKLKLHQQLILDKLFSASHLSVVKVIKKVSGNLKQSRLTKLIGNGDVVLLSSLKGKFYLSLDEIKSRVYESLTAGGIFDGNPEKVKQKYVGIHIFVTAFFAGGIFLFGGLTANYAPLGLLFLLLGPGIFLTLKMARRTAWGHSLYRQSLGLKNYLNVGQWRHEVYEKNLFFEEMLPLAVSLGVVNKLAKDMRTLGVPPPTYLNLAPATFAGDVKRMNSSMSKTFISTPAGKSFSGRSSWSGGSGFSGGGGSSGGGFGGGGGGSW